MNSKGRGHNGKWLEKKINNICVVDTNVERLRLPTGHDANSVTWFINYTQWMLEDGPRELSTQDLVIGTLIATEAINNKVSLLNALRSLNEIKLDGDGPYICWLEGEVTCRLRLSHFTMLAIGRITEWPESWTVECGHFIENVAKKYKLLDDGSFDAAYTKLFSCALQYHYYLLPPPCANYLAGVLPLALLPEVVQLRRVGIRPRRGQEVTENSIDVLSPLMDASVDQLWGANSKSRYNKAVVAALQQVFRGDDIERIRLADYLQKKSLRLDLDRISKLVLQSGCPVNALLTLWVIHLFEWGSVRLRNPTAGTIRRYVQAIVEILYEALLEVDISPVQISQEKWDKFFADLLITVDGNDVQKNALKSFHRFLIIHLGIDPVDANWGEGSEVAIPQANVIWPHELGQAFKLIPHFTSDLRLQKMMASMLAMGGGNPLRIGDLPGLTAGCISRSEVRLRIDIFHRHGQHRGKSAAATRSLDYQGVEYSEYIRSWLDYREADGEFGDNVLVFCDDVLVFGDPNRAGKCYRLGLCLRLLNQILKAATGDSSASFHMLRHTCISNEIVEDLLIADIPNSITRSKEIAAKAGQKNDLTTYSSYFHFPENVIRKWIDAGLSKVSNSPSLAGIWLNCKVNTLTVAKGRNSGDEYYLENRLRQAASIHWPEKRSTNEEIDISLIKCIPCLDAEQGFQKTLHILNAVVAGLGLQVIAARNDTSPEHIVDICRAAIKASNAAVSQDKRKRVAATANSDFLLKSAKSLVDEVFCHFPIVESVLEGPLQYLRAAVEPDDAMRAAVLSWQEAKQGKYINFTDSSLLTPFASLLVDAGVPAQNFYICLAIGKEVTPDIAAMRLSDPDVVSALSVFENLAMTSLQVVSVTPAKGRPILYLMLCRNRIVQGRVPSSAESRTNRLHALMLAMAVWIELLKTREKKNES